MGPSLLLADRTPIHLKSIYANARRAVKLSKAGFTIIDRPDTETPFTPLAIYFQWNSFHSGNNGKSFYAGLSPFGKASI
jgi:hypothetical protein